MCPLCRYPGPTRTVLATGHCKRDGRVRNCRRRPENSQSAFAISTRPDTNGLSISNIVLGRCLALPGIVSFEDALPGGLADGDADYIFAFPEYVNGVLIPVDVELDEGSYDYDGEIPPPAHFGVKTAEEFQEALHAGALHITILERLDMTDSPVEPDLVGLEGLNAAVGRVLNTTRSITVRLHAAAPAAGRSYVCCWCCDAAAADSCDPGNNAQAMGICSVRLVTTPAGFGLLLYLPGVNDGDPTLMRKSSQNFAFLLRLCDAVTDVQAQGVSPSGTHMCPS